MLGRNQEEKILDAAYTVIARVGYSQTSLRQIAQEANVAVSQISYHYQNKQGLLLAVVRRVANSYYAYMQAHLKSGMSPQEKGECFILLYQEVFTEEYVGKLGYDYTPEELSSMFFGAIFGIGVQALLEPDNKTIATALGALNTILKLEE